MKVSIRLRENEQGGFVAECTSLPGCISRGETPKEATERLDEAIRGYVAALNNFVPEQLDHELLDSGV